MAPTSIKLGSDAHARLESDNDNSRAANFTLRVPAGYHLTGDMLRDIRTHSERDHIVLRAIYNAVRVTIKQGPVSADTDVPRQMVSRTNRDPVLYYNGKPYQIHKSYISSH